jgi:TolB-like protein/DNA-binding winged helix-turn-helix (wHTH) protein/Tfp pilus assembly protein PilF
MAEGERLPLFGEYVLDMGRGCLLRAGRPVHLRPQAYRALKFLTENRGRLVSKNSLIEEVWEGRAVTDDSLVQCLRDVRRALGDSGEQYLRNERGRGYIFELATRNYERREATSWTEQVDLISFVVEDEAEEVHSSEIDQPASPPSSLTRRSEMATMTNAARGPAALDADSVVGAVKPHRLAAILILAALALTAAGIMYLSRFAPRGQAIRSMAVLPFTNASGDPNLEYLSDGISESLINSLSQLPQLKVIARNSSFKYKSNQVDLNDVARALGVQAILLGRVEQHGDNLTVSAELVDARDGTQVWGGNYSRSAVDIQTMQEEIARTIFEKLQLKLTGEEQTRLARRHTENTEAYESYLRGRYCWNRRNKEGFEKAIEYFNQAIEKDPVYALAYAGLADSYALLANYSAVPRKESYSRAKAEAKRALQIDDTLAEAHAALAFVMWNELDLPGAEREFKRAVNLNPNYATAHHWYGNYLMSVGRHTEASAEIKRALELDPLSLIINTALGGQYYRMRQYDKAIEQLRKTLELEPNFVNAHEFLGGAYLQKGMYEEAIVEFQKAVELSGRWEVELSKLGHAYAVAGRRAEAQKILDELKEMRARQQISSTNIALVHAGLGENDRALAWLEKAYQEQDQRVVSIMADPVLDNLRSEPRFKDLARRIEAMP